MSRMVRTICLTLAGCGLLVGSTLLEESAQLHDTIRARVLAGIGSGSASAEMVRAGLRGDPDFGLLLECLCRRTLSAIRHPVHGEDALQETFLKTWKGRPEMFLKSHDEAVRYFRAATRKNLLTLLRRASPVPRVPRTDESALDAVADSREPDPLAETSARDLLQRLVERLDAEERDVLEQYLAGARSERQVAAALGGTRYAAGQATESIRRKVEQLLAEPDVA